MRVNTCLQAWVHLEGVKVSQFLLLSWLTWASAPLLLSDPSISLYPDMASYLSWSESGADNTKVVGLIPVEATMYTFPFPFLSTTSPMESYIRLQILYIY